MTSSRAVASVGDIYSQIYIIVSPPAGTGETVGLRAWEAPRPTIVGGAFPARPTVSTTQTSFGDELYGPFRAE
jgi:hypothetical protein